MPRRDSRRSRRRTRCCTILRSGRPTINWVRDYRSGQAISASPDWSQRFGHSGGQRPSDLNGFSDFFSTLFGGAAAAPTDVDAGQLDVTVEEAYAGAKRRVALTEGGPFEVGGPADSGRRHRRPSSAGGRNRRPPIADIQGPAAPASAVRPDRQGCADRTAPWRPGRLLSAPGWPCPTLGGTVELTIPAGAQSGQKLRLRGRGLPGTPGGDQLVSIKLVTPAAASAEDKKAYERMKSEFDFDPRAGWPYTA